MAWRRSREQEDPNHWDLQKVALRPMDSAAGIS